MQITPQQQDFLLDLARATMRAVLRGQSPPSIPPTADPLITTPAGCFGSLHELGNHRLRGCVGRIQSDQPLLQTIRDSAVSCLQDPRFTNMPVTLSDLPRLDLELSVLSPLVQAAHPLDFEPLEDGIYLFCAGRSGTFLPQVARQTGWSREQLLARLCTEKMGLPSSSWQDPTTTKLLKYKAVVIGPVPFNTQRQVTTAPAPAAPNLTFSTEPTPPRNVGFGNGNVFRI